MRPVLLDLFCGGGGASKGYYDAGFDVIGVDINPQPNYPFEFHQGDFRELFHTLKPRIDAVHGSPPCHAHSKGLLGLNRKLGRSVDYPDFVSETQEMFDMSGLPFVIENVPGAPLRNPTVLCGSSFGLPIRRHRLFETSFSVDALPCDHTWQTERKYPSNRRDKNGIRQSSFVVQVYGIASKEAYSLWPDAMGIDWMNPKELTQAIPPAYTKYIGEFLLKSIENATP